MFHARRPTAAEIEAALAAARDVPFSYREPGRTRGPRPARVPVNRYRACLGRGDALYDRAVAAVRRWAMYDLPWTEVRPRGAAVEAGAAVVVVARHFGFWSLNPCRVVYVEEGPGRFAFALGTLAGHSERGEERFRVEMEEGDMVWFEVLAFAGPRHWLTWAGYPLLRGVQRRFARAAAEAVARAVARAASRAPG